MKWVVPLLMAAMLAGCAQESAPEEEVSDESFDDVKVTVTDDTGAIRGVVVNDAIVPVSDASVELPVASDDVRTTTSDQQGRFSFSEVPPGTYIMTITKAAHESAQVGVTVEVGIEKPDIVKVQLARLFDQDPYLETVEYAGFIGCAYRTGVLVSISSTCVNDYTRLAPVCGNGCAPQVTGIVDQREYRSEVGPGWQSIVWEMVWDTSVSGTSDSLGLTVSYAERIGASHWYTSSVQSPPYRLQCDVDTDCPGVQTDGDNPEGRINPDGQDNLWNMVSSGSGTPSGFAFQQEMEVFQTNFYYTPAPEGWSFVAGDRDL